VLCFLQLHLGKSQINACGDLQEVWNLVEAKIRHLVLEIFLSIWNDQVQMASTESFFMTFGHGSPPKFSGDTVTLHQFCPMQFCNNKMNPRYFIIEPLILEFSI
jgi:hypothetical protein